MLNINISIPSECHEIKEILEEIAEVTGTLSSSPCVPLEEVETCVRDLMLRNAQKLVEACVSAHASQQSEEPVECPECEQVCRPIQKRGVNITTLCGKIRVNRWVYKCSSGHYHRPWDVRQKLIGKWTRRVVERICNVAAHFDYRAAVKELSFQGIEVSHTAVREKVLECSEDLNVCEQVECQTLEDNQRWYVSCDGCHTNSQEGWKETKVGCIYRDYPQPPNSSGATPSARTPSIRYVAERENAAHFGKELYKLATQSGIYQEDIGTQEVVFIGDGAAWIWNLADEYFPNAVEIVDYMHAKSHLYDVAKVAFGETETEDVETWVTETEPFLFDGNIPEVVSRIRALATQHPDVCEILVRETGYFEKHAKRMQYKTFREKGYQVGSGVIESACKHVVGQRCKQAAMRWKKEGINSVLALRCLVKNKAWDRYWMQHPQAA